MPSKEAGYYQGQCFFWQKPGWLVGFREPGEPGGPGGPGGR